MLLSLSIRDFVLIEKLDLNLAPAASDGGLSALTGETGAGKSILIDALSLALGARADSAAVRRGVAQASVAAAFVAPSGSDVSNVGFSCAPATRVSDVSFESSNTSITMRPLPVSGAVTIT